MKILRTLLVTSAIAGTAGALAIPASAASTVKVTATSMKFKISGSAHAGSVTFVVTNQDTLPHDFAIGGKNTGVIAKGKTKRLTVTLKKGKAAYRCTLHPAMKGTLTVS